MLEFVWWLLVIVIVWAWGYNNKNENKRIPKNNKTVCCGMSVQKGFPTPIIDKEDDVSKMQEPVPYIMDKDKGG